MDNSTVIEPQQTSTIAYTRVTGRQVHILRAVWLLLAALSVILLLAGTIARLDNIANGNNSFYSPLSTQLGISPMVVPIWNTITATLLAIVFCGVAFILFWRRSDSLVSLSSSLTVITLGVVFSSSLDYIPVTTLLGLAIINLYRVIAAGLQLNALFVFPDGYYYPRWAWMFVIVNMVYSIGRFFAQSGNSNALLPLYVIFELGFIAIGVISQVQRYRLVSNDNQKHQTKWVIFGIVIGLLSYYLVVIPVLFIPALSAPTGSAQLIQIILLTIGRFGLMALPICGGIAILRFHLYDIDLIISRSLIYGALTAILAAVFFVILLVIQALFQQSSLALAASTVTVAVLFQPMRDQLRRFVARRFYHESARTLIAQPPITPGTYTGLRLGAYEVLEPLGAGGMAEVYKGRQTTLNRPVAIKILNRTMSADVNFRKRFEREAQAIAQLSHPNIIQIFDYGVQDSVYYIAMEYITGQDLTHHMDKQGKMPLETAVPLLTEVAAALDYAHEHGFVHRDVKPSNIMLEPDGQSSFGYRAILMDFGIAKMVTSQTDLTNTGMVGTLDYMAPEQIMAAHDVTPQADIYSLGVVAYRLLTGVLPYTSDNPGAIILAHLQTPARDPRKTMPDLSVHVSETLLQVLEKNPLDRPTSAGEFIKQLTS